MRTKPTTTRYFADFGTYTVRKTTVEAAEADRTNSDCYFKFEVDAWNHLEAGALEGVRISGRDVIKAEETLQRRKDEAAEATKDYETCMRNRKASKCQQ